MNNVIIKPDNNISILDFEWWQGGNPLDDLGTNLFYSLRANEPYELYQFFLQGYFNGKSITNEQMHSILFYTMLAASRVVSFCTRTNTEKLGEALTDLNKTLEFIKPRLP